MTISVSTGDFVRISGLKAAAQYNGFIGKVAQVDTLPESPRISVTFPYYGSMETKSIKPTNLERIENKEPMPIRACFSPRADMEKDTPLRWVQINNKPGSERNIFLILGLLDHHANINNANTLELSPQTVANMYAKCDALSQAEAERYTKQGRQAFKLEQMPMEHIKTYIATAEAQKLEGKPG